MEKSWMETLAQNPFESIKKLSVCSQLVFQGRIINFFVFYLFNNTFNSIIIFQKSLYEEAIILLFVIS